MRHIWVGWFPTARLRGAGARMNVSYTPGGGRGERSRRRLLEKCRYAEQGGPNGNCRPGPQSKGEHGLGRNSDWVLRGQDVMILEQQRWCDLMPPNGSWNRCQKLSLPEQSQCLRKGRRERRGEEDDNHGIFPKVWGSQFYLCWLYYNCFPLLGKRFLSFSYVPGAVI